MSRSRHPKCPNGRTSCRCCTDRIGAGRRAHDATRHADAVPAAMVERDEREPDSGVFEIPHLDRL